MRIKGEGQLRHMFHGSYACMIGIDFGSEVSCDQALEVLKIGTWKKSEKHPEFAIGSLDSEQLERFKEKFKPKCKPCNSFDCKGKNSIHEIDGVNHSLDYGPPFEIELDVENPNQGKLF